MEQGLLQGKGKDLVADLEQAVCVCDMLPRGLNLTLKIMEHFQGSCAQPSQTPSVEGSLCYDRRMDIELFLLCLLQ